MINKTTKCNRPFVDEDGVYEELSDIMYTLNLSMGRNVERFENILSEYTSKDYGIAFHSATNAFDAYFKMNLKDGDEVIISPFTFHSVIYSIISNGGVPVLIDIKDSFLPDWSQIESYLTNKTKVVVVTHIFGMPDDAVFPLIKLGRERGFKVVEDCAQAIGGKYMGGNIGTAKCDASIFSFYATKNINSVEGGILVTDNSAYNYALRSLRNNGLCVSDNKLILGTNMRMSDIHAAFGISNFKHLEDITKKRQIQADYYYQLLDLDLPTIPHGYQHAWHHFTILVEKECRWDIFKKVKLDGYELGTFYKYMVNDDLLITNILELNQTPNARRLSESCLQLPMGWDIGPGQQENLIRGIKEAYDGPIYVANASI